MYFKANDSINSVENVIVDSLICYRYFARCNQVFTETLHTMQYVAARNQPTKKSAIDEVKIR